ncbi:unnamed protein product [Owenia fusiformis]|uniref:N-acetylgalactosaminide beta-1,3-galactosyltransferase n=1 Tax=Owenia fusiformis TaxID=6347 RepID=A0A8S4P812_OWEFU|nr:unnamed protein product [Owenia fusiformis]
MQVSKLINVRRVFLALLLFTIGLCVIMMQLSGHHPTAFNFLRTKNPKVFCWVLTTPWNLPTKATAVKNTWIKRCDGAVFVTSNHTDPNFPTLALNITEGRKYLSNKSFTAFKYLYNNHLSDFDWFLKADDDTYVIMENLKHFLKGFNPSDPLYFGHYFSGYFKGKLKVPVKQGYASGGAGYVISQEALRRMQEIGSKDTKYKCRRNTGFEDGDIGICLENLNVTLGVSLDNNRQMTFHPFNVIKELNKSPKESKMYQYINGNISIGKEKGARILSSNTISFHYVSPALIYLIDFLIYDLNVHQLRASFTSLHIKSPRVFCWVLTTPGHLPTRATAVRNTWLRRCDGAMFVTTDYNDPNFPVMALNITEGRQHLSNKSFAAFKYLYNHHLQDFDWFLKADDDTYVIIENLKHFLKGFNPSDPLYFGHHFGGKRKIPVKQGYASGGAGYVLSQEALRRMQEIGTNDAKYQCRKNTGYEDADIGICLEKLNVTLGVSRDNNNQMTFHSFHLLKELNKRPTQESIYQYVNRNIKIGNQKGERILSSSTISFHYVDPGTMYFIDFLIYDLNVHQVRGDNRYMG